MHIAIAKRMARACSWRMLFASSFDHVSHVARQRLVRAVVISSSLLAGCTTSPPAPNMAVNVSHVTNAVLTELYCAVGDLQDEKIHAFDYPDWWLTTIDLFLSTNIEGAVSPSISLLGPFNPIKSVPAGGSPGSYTLTAGGSVDQMRISLREYKAYIYINNLMTNWKTTAAKENPPWTVDCHDPGHGGTYLEGTLGLEQWLEPSFQAQLLTRSLTQGAQPGLVSDVAILPSNRVIRRNGSLATRVVPEVLPFDAAMVPNVFPVISTTITFTIKASASLGPSFVLSRVSSTGNTLSLSRTDNNYLTISTTPTKYVANPTSKLAFAPPQVDAVSAAVGRLENSLLNQQLQQLRLVTQ